MTEEEAVEYVTLTANTGGNPSLTEPQVIAIVRSCALVDADGNPPTIDGDDNEDWTPKYWTARAVYLALNLRATIAADWPDISTDGTTIKSSIVVQQLERAAAQWRRRCAGGA